MRVGFWLGDARSTRRFFRTLERNIASLTQGVVKFAQVAGVENSGSFSRSSHGELALELLSWEQCASNLKRRVEQSWQRLYMLGRQSMLSTVHKCVVFHGHLAVLQEDHALPGGLLSALQL